MKDCYASSIRSYEGNGSNLMQDSKCTVKNRCCSSSQSVQKKVLFTLSATNSGLRNESSSQKVEKINIANQPDEDDDDDDDEDAEDGLWVPPSPRSASLTTDTDVGCFSLSFLLPVQTDLWGGLNCHVTFFVADGCSVADFAGETGVVAVGMGRIAAMLVVTPLTFLALPLLFLSSSMKSSVSTSGSVASPNKSQLSSAGGRLGCATPTDLFAAAEILEGRLGSESDRSESQSLSPASDPQPSTDTSTGPDPELSESDSLQKHRQTEYKAAPKVIT